MLSYKVLAISVVLSFCFHFLSGSDRMVFPIAVTGLAGDGKKYETIIEFLTPTGSRTECWGASTNDFKPFFFFPSTTGLIDGTCISGRTRSFTRFNMNSLDRLQNGWAEVELKETDAVFMAAQSQIRLIDENGEILSIASVPGMRPTQEFVVPWLRSTDNGDGVRPAYTFVNPSPEHVASIVLTLKNDWSTPHEFSCQRTLELLPKHRVAQFGDELFSSCTPPAGVGTGVLQIESDVPIAAGAIRVFV